MTDRWHFAILIAICLVSCKVAVGIPTITGVSPSSGLVSTVVTIHGTGMTSPGSVSLGPWVCGSGCWTSWSTSITGLTTIVLSIQSPATSGYPQVTASGLTSNNTTLPFTLTGVLTYTARTDNCVTGAETGCPGTTTGCGSGGADPCTLTFLGNQLNIGTQQFPWFQTAGTIDPTSTAVTDPDFHSYQVMLTSRDLANTIFSNRLTTFNAQAGEFDPFSQDDSLVLAATDRGGWAVLALNTAGIAAKTCSSSNICVIPTGISTGATDTHCPSSGQGGTQSNCTLLNTAGSFSFSRTPGEFTVLYELMGSNPGTSVGYQNLQVNKLTISCSGSWMGMSGPTCTFSRQPYVNFSANATCPASLVPTSFSSNSPWSGVFAMANDGSVGYATGGAGDWLMGTVYANNNQNDVFVYPQSGNSGQYAFQNIGSSCTAGSSEPSFVQALTVSGTVNTSGPSVTWVSGNVSMPFTSAWAAPPNTQRIIINGSSYTIASYGSPTTLTLTSSAGTQTGASFTGPVTPDNTCTWENIGQIGEQDLGFDLFFFKNATTPACSRYNTRTNYIFNGSSAVAALTDSAAAAFNSCLDQYDYCSGMGGHSCSCGSGTTPCSPTGWNGYRSGQRMGCNSVGNDAITTPVAVTDVGPIHDGGVKANSQYFLWAPAGGGGTPNTNGANKNFDYQLLKMSARSVSDSSYVEEVPFTMFWDTTANIVRPAQMGVHWSSATTLLSGNSDGHAIDGYNNTWKSTFSESHFYSQPNSNLACGSTSGPPPVNCSGSVNGCYEINPPAQPPALGNCQIGNAYSSNPLLNNSRQTGIEGATWDEHGAHRQLETSDQTAGFLFNTSTPGLGMNSNNGNGGYINIANGGCSPPTCPSAAGYFEITGMAPQAVTGCSAGTNGAYCQWRFAHSWNTGSSVQFNTQNNQGMNSTDGKYAVWSTDVMGTRGSVSPDWAAGAQHVVGDFINPQSGNNNHSDYQVVSGYAPAGIPCVYSTSTAPCTCTTSTTTEPLWNGGSNQQSGTGGIVDGVASGIAPTACTWANVSGFYGTQQLSCNGLRGDLGATQSNGTTVYQYSTLASADTAQKLYQAKMGPPNLCGPGNDFSKTCGLPLSATPNFTCNGGVLSPCTDGTSDGITWIYLGSNDCAGDLVLVDLTSAD